MYKTKIVEIGSIVEDFEEECLLVLFGPEIPQELKDICVIHESAEVPKNVIKAGGHLKIGDQVYIITEVGSEANQNFEELGHVSIYFRDGKNEVLPGAIVVQPQVFPKLKIDELICFE